MKFKNTNNVKIKKLDYVDPIEVFKKFQDYNGNKL